MKNRLFKDQEDKLIKCEKCQCLIHEDDAKKVFVCTSFCSAYDYYCLDCYPKYDKHYMDVNGGTYYRKELVEVDENGDYIKTPKKK